MDKELLERVSVGIQLLGYGLFIHSLFIEPYYPVEYSTFYQLIYYSWDYVRFRDGQMLYLIICFSAPIIIRWMLTGKIKFLPVVSKED